MLTTDLYPYQVPAMDMFLDRGSLLLAMEQGVGKTMVSIAIAEELLGCEDISLNLVVVPASLKYQWAEQIAAHTDIPTVKIKVKGEYLTIPAAPYGVIINGSPEARSLEYASITEDTDYVIMGYDNILDDWPLIRKHIMLKPSMMVTLDECSAIKGMTSRRSQRIKRRLNVEYRLGLTGTPMENRPDEAYSIMQWVDRDVLGEWPYFEKTFIRRNGNGTVRKYMHLPLFHELMSQAMYRKKRSDPDVAPYMPDEEYDIWSVNLDDATLFAYQDMGRDLLDQLHSMRRTGKFDLAATYIGKNDESTHPGKVMSVFTAMEMLLDHPDLIIDSGTKYEARTSKNIHGSKYCYEKWQGGVVDQLFDSPKLRQLWYQLEKIFEADPDAKVLIYTRWRYMLDILADVLPFRSVQYHGDLTAGGKAAVVAEFGRDPEIRLFISSHAGAYGCDMFMANHLVNYDRDWSAGKGDQINGRPMRASSEFSKVWVHDMECTGTIEKWKRDVLTFKRRLSSAVVDGEGMDSSGHITNDVQSLTTWLDHTICPR